MAKSDKNGDKPTYAAAYEELRRILDSLEQGEIDVDELSVQVKRAAELIEFCQKRLRETEVEVKKIVEKFEGAAKPDQDEPEE